MTEVVHSWSKHTHEPMDQEPISETAMKEDHLRLQR